MAKVLVIATSRKTCGGITSVIKAHEQGEQWKEFHCKWIQTHRDGYALRKIYYFIKGFCRFIFLLPFCDLVHIHIAAVNRKLPFVYLAKLLNKKLIVHLHFPDPETTLYDKRLSPRYGWCIKKADICLVLSHTWKNMIEERYQVNNVRVLYNPCPSVKRTSNEQREKYILFAGTVSRRKGNLDLVEAFSKISAKHSDWKIKIAGNGDIAEGVEHAKKIGIENQVEFLGWVSGKDKDELFKNAAIYCLPSYAEGFPMSVLDAWAYGIPVITTPVGGIPDVAKDFDNMMVFTPGDVEALADKLDILISNTHLRDRIAQASCYFADEVFNVKTITHHLSMMYSELLSEK